MSENRYVAFILTVELAARILELLKATSNLL
jgi:hypothetical protein